MRDLLFDQHAHAENFLHKLDPRTKILVLFTVIVVAVSTPPQHAPLLFVYSAFLAVVALLGRVPIRLLLLRLAIAAPFILMVSVFVPFMEPPKGSEVDQWTVFLVVTSKALLGVLALSLLTATTRFEALLSGFERLRVPKLLLMLTSFTYRYLFVLVEEAQRMKRARDSRAFRGRWIWQARVVGQMIGTLFLRSYERGERVYLAMCARGYDGSSRAFFAQARPLRLTDYAFTLGSLIILVAARFGPWI